MAVQAMTNTDTADPKATAHQAAELYRAGAEIVRVTVNTEAAARAVPEVKARLADLGAPVPLVGDFHFSGHVLLRKYPEAAQALDKFRINPGTLGKKRKDEAFAEMIQVAKDLDKPIRIGLSRSFATWIISAKASSFRFLPRVPGLMRNLSRAWAASGYFLKRTWPEKWKSPTKGTGAPRSASLALTSGTALAAASVFTVTRTISAPAR